MKHVPLFVLLPARETLDNWKSYTNIVGKSSCVLKRIINAKGYRTKLYTSRRGRVQGGKKFMKTTINRILTNPFYIGKVIHKGNLYQGKHEGIIPLDLWEKVQGIIASNQ